MCASLYNHPQATFYVGSSRFRAAHSVRKFQLIPPSVKSVRKYKYWRAAGDRSDWEAAGRSGYILIFSRSARLLEIRAKSAANQAMPLNSSRVVRRVIPVRSIYGKALKCALLPINGFRLRFSDDRMVGANSPRIFCRQGPGVTEIYKKTIIYIYRKPKINFLFECFILFLGGNLSSLP